MPSRSKRGTGRPNTLPSVPANTPGLPPIRRQGRTALIKVPMDEDGNLVYGRLVESKLREILEDDEMMEGMKLMAKYGLRRILRPVTNESTGEIKMEEQLEPISAREQLAAKQFLYTRALPSIAMTGRLPGGGGTPDKEADQGSPEAKAIIEQYS